MSSTKDSEKLPLTRKQASSSSSSGSRAFDCCLTYISTITRLCALAVLAMMWAATVLSLRGQVKTPTYVGYYLLAASIVATFFEITWLLDKIACCVREGCCCRCWSVILWIDGWRKFILYVALSVPLFLQGLSGVIDVVTGFCLLVLACLYLIKSFANLRRGDSDTSVQESVPVSVSVVRHEISTQTEVTSPATERKSTPPNPFDESGTDEEEKDSTKTDAKGEKAKDEASK